MNITAQVYEQVVDYLKNKTGGKLVMSSAQLADELPISVKQQSKLRQDNSFPIPSQTIGRKVYYSVFHIAEFLTTGATSDDTAPPPAPSAKATAGRRSQKNSTTQNLSHLFLLKALAVRIEEEAKYLKALSNALEMFADRSDFKERLSNDLEAKPDDSEQKFKV
jgi:hypothetical protein